MNAMNPTTHDPASPATVPGLHRFDYRLRHDELGPGGWFPASVLTGVLQEAAIDGSAAQGYPFRYYLRERGLWVIRRLAFRHDRPLRYDDALAVSTWVAHVGKTSPVREYRFASPANDATIARVRSHWVYLDAVSGMPKAIPDDLRAAFAPTGETQTPLFEEPEPVDELRGEPWVALHTVGASDVDRAGHLKCCRFLTWIEDLLAAAGAAVGARPGSVALASFDLQLLASARYGERVRLVAHADTAWRIAFTGDGDRALARAVAWPTTPDLAHAAFVPLAADLAQRLRCGPHR